MSNPLSNRVLAFVKRPIGVLSIIGVALITLCCCTSGVLGGLMPDGSAPASTPSATRRTTVTPSASATPTAAPTLSLSPTVAAPAVVAPTTPAQPKPQPTKTTKSPTKPSCHPNYSVCLPIVGDLNCGDISHKNFRVIGGRDPYGLDRDNDGIACEEN